MWKTTDVGERFRLIHYIPNQSNYFTWHYDGLTYLSPTRQNVATLTIYLTTLNEGNGGRTMFKDSSISSILPKCNDALLLDVQNHPEHKGEMVGGKDDKIILRVDLIGELTTEPEPWLNELYDLRTKADLYLD